MLIEYNSLNLHQRCEPWLHSAKRHKVSLPSLARALPEKVEMKHQVNSSWVSYRNLGSARWYDAAPSWLTPDPLTEKAPSISPYVYCADNPVNAIDPDGRDYVLTLDDETKTVTVSATYYSTTSDIESAGKGRFVNNTSHTDKELKKGVF